MKRTVLIVALVAACAAPGCRVFRRTPAKPPPPPPPLVTPESVPAPKAGPAELPQPPEIEPEEDVTQIPGPPGERLPGPPRRPRRTRPPETAATPAQPPEPSPQPVAPPAVPQLGQVLTPEQQQSYNAAIDRNLDRARNTVIVLASRRLNREQNTYLERIKAFIQQAAEARRTDLVRAASLAERASVLADDLLKSSQ